MSKIYPCKPTDLTVAWAQSVFALHNCKATVTKTEIAHIDVGTTTRVRLAVEHDGPESLPRRWFVKLPSLNRRARLITALPRLLPTEVRFYQEILPHVPVPIPQCLAAHSKFGLGAVLVLADVTESGAIAGQPGDALTLQQAVAVIEQLGSLHARFWNKVHDVPAYRWLAGRVRRLEDGLGVALALPLMKRGLRLAGAHIPSVLHGPALHYARHRRTAMCYLADAPQTLVHHDCHAGNLFWSRDLASPGFLDWQLVRLGEGIGDVAYFLATALDTQTRRQHEASLLACYMRALEHGGVTNIDGAKLMSRYRAHLVYPFEAMIVTLAVGGMMEVSSNLELIKRATAAVADADAFAALPI